MVCHCGDGSWVFVDLLFYGFNLVFGWLCEVVRFFIRRRLAYCVADGLLAFCGLVYRLLWIFFVTWLLFVYFFGGCCAIIHCVSLFSCVIVYLACVFVC